MTHQRFTHTQGRPHKTGEEDLRTMVEALSSLNCFCRRVMLSDTLKKSIASQVQVNHLRE